MASTNNKGSVVKIDGRPYKVGAPVAGYMMTDECGYECMMTTGQLDAGKRTVIPGSTVDMSKVDLATMSKNDKEVLKAALKKEAGLSK